MAQRLQAKAVRASGTSDRYDRCRSRLSAHIVADAPPEPTRQVGSYHLDML